MGVFIFPLILLPEMKTTITIKRTKKHLPNGEC